MQKCAEMHFLFIYIWHFLFKVKHKIQSCGAKEGIWIIPSGQTEYTAVKTWAKGAEWETGTLTRLHF